MKRRVGVSWRGSLAARAGVVVAIPFLVAALGHVASSGRASAQSGVQPESALDVAPDSNSHNYATGTNESVNPRTGALSLVHPVASIPGKQRDMSLELRLNYTGSGASVYGVAPGWMLDWSYVTSVNGSWNVSVQGRGSYQAIPEGVSPSGVESFSLRYYVLDDLTFQALGTLQATPCGSAIPLPDYRFLLQHHDGKAEYFDIGGRLICIQDRFENALLFGYQEVASESAGPLESHLTTIVDTWGHTTTISTAGTFKTIALPDGRAVRLGFTGSSLTSISDPYSSGAPSAFTNLTLDAYSRPVQLTYPNGAVTVINFVNQGMPYGASARKAGR